MLSSPLLRQTNATFNHAIELCNCSFDMQPIHAILCINRTKKSFHVTIYKQARIWSIRTEQELIQLYYCKQLEVLQ